MDFIELHNKFKKRYGQQGWWPIYDPSHSCLIYGVKYVELEKYQMSFRDPYFEIAIGAILAQNALWKNVAVAIVNIFNENALNPRMIAEMNHDKLKKLIYSTGYYSQKAKKLKLFSEWLVEKYDGNILKLKSINIVKLRKNLLNMWGIGRETADCISLYALNNPIFMVDAYTKRLCGCFGIEFKDYDQCRIFFEEKLRKEYNNLGYEKLVDCYREFHALIVASGKDKHVYLTN